MARGVRLAGSALPPSFRIDSLGFVQVSPLERSEDVEAIETAFNVMAAREVLIFIRAIQERTRLMQEVTQQ